jgi:hypothetical protein
MIDTQAFTAVIDGINPVVSLVGNSGRAVRRALERHFDTQPDGAAAARLTIRSDTGGIAFAFLAREARYAAYCADEGAKDNGLAGVTFAVTGVDATALRIEFEVRIAAVPEAMAERQQLLDFLARELQATAQRLERTPQTIEGMFFQMFEGVRGQNQDRDQRYLAQFEKLVAGDFGEIADTPCVLLDMAKDLNPAVVAAEAQMDARFAADEEMMRFFAHG